ncbi:MULTISPECIES: hypothetical protein [Cytobacillus]|uniref:hypothetical protein n=1 Tax=Cytobacillus TaxID=2675230 RepID=UPI00203FDBF7|nr:hypothetical protein [Cytobacillus firmus]
MQTNLNITDYVFGLNLTLGKFMSGTGKSISLNNGSDCTFAEGLNTAAHAVILYMRGPAMSDKSYFHIKTSKFIYYHPLWII